MMKRLISVLVILFMIAPVSSLNVSAEEISSSEKELIHELYYNDYSGEEFDVLYNMYVEKYGVQNVLLEDIINMSLYASGIPTDYSSYFEKSYFYERSDGAALGVWWKDFLFENDNNVNVAMAKASKAWTALENKHKNDSYWDNGDSLEVQFHCHVTTIGMLKKPWNIEPWRTETDLTLCTLAGCNP